MAQGRGSAELVTIAVMLCLVVACEMAEAATTYRVGDAGGWTFNVVGWTKGKRFTSGDTLVFNYSPSVHNVVAVDKAGYDNCRTPKGAKVYRTGRDKIRLVKGPNFFICNFPGHCESGMKIAITAA